MANPDVSTQPILSEQTGRYKRNTLIACLIITVLYFTDAPLGNVKFFGVWLSGVEDREATAWFVFAVIAFLSVGYDGLLWMAGLVQMGQ